MPTDATGWTRIAVRPTRGTGDLPRAELLAAARILLYRYGGQREFTVAGGEPGSPWAVLDPDQPWCDQLRALGGAAATGLAADGLSADLGVTDGHAAGGPPRAEVRAAPTGTVAPDPPAEPAGLPGVVVAFDPARFHPALAQRLPGHLERIVAQVTANPRASARELELLTEAERAQVVHDFNDTATGYPREATIHGLFAEHAASERPAVVVHGGRAMSYRELHAASARLAATLHERGVGVGADVGRPVGLLMPRSAQWVVATLAILRAGGAYLPLDPRYPAQRLRFLLADSRAAVLVTTSELAALAADAGFAGELVLVDDLADAARATELEGGGAPEPADRTGPQDVAYVMYTSGTTGRPKGVLVTHRNVVRLVRGASYVDLSPSTRILAANAIVFDSSTFELWASLLNGGTLVLVDTDVLLDAARLGAAIAEHGVTTLMLTPALFNQLADQDPAVFRPLRDQFVGGDVLSPSHINAVRQACPRLRIVNGYGPTENTTISACHPITERHDDHIPIGRPISNSTAYVCDAEGRPLPVGVPGELWVGGDGLARGYLDRPQLTAAAFVSSTLDPGGRLYRTGDLARWRPDGTLDFLGRLDDQVKIRGFRIEPAEIEHRLREHPDVRDAVVLVRTRPATGEKYLCAYVRTDLTGRELREYLGGELPDHMIPAYAVPLAEFPMTAAGKLDRAALPEPCGAADADEYVAARTQTERALVRLWQDTLGVRPVGVTDDIFDLGISSLAAAAMALGIQRELGVSLPATALLRNRTIALVAGLVDAELRTPRAATPHDTLAATPHDTWASQRSDAGALGRPHTDGPAAPRDTWASQRSDAGALGRPHADGGYPLSPQQHQLYVEQLKDPAAVAYNQPIVVDLPADVDAQRLAAALGALVERHEQLRSAFVTVDGQVRQRPETPAAAAAALDVRVVDGPPPAVAEFVRPFDLAAPPLLRAALHRHAGGVRLLLDLHHIAVDGVSLRVLLDELDALYAGRELPALPRMRYVEYAEWTRGPEAAGRLDADEAYWLGVYADAPPPLELPTDAARGATRRLAGATLEFDLGAARTAALRRLAAETGSTLFQLLLACYGVFLSRVTGSSDFAVGTPVAGRSAPGLDSVVGMFVNTVCLRVRPAPELRFTEFLDAVRGHVLAAYEHQDYPFDRLVQRVAPVRDYSRNPIFDTMFAVQPAALHDLRLLGSPARLADDGLGQSMFDLNLHVFEHPDTLRAVWGYATALFAEGTVAALRDVLLATVDELALREWQRASERPLPLTTYPQVHAAAVPAGAPPDIDFDFFRPEGTSHA